MSWYQPDVYWIQPPSAHASLMLPLRLWRSNQNVRKWSRTSLSHQNGARQGGTQTHRRRRPGGTSHTTGFSGLTTGAFSFGSAAGGSGGAGGGVGVSASTAG